MYWWLSQYQFVSKQEIDGPTSQSDEACPSKQYRRGQGAFSRQRVVTVAVPCQGVFVGASDRNYLRMRAGVSDTWGREKTYRIGFGSGRLLNGLANRFQSPVEPRAPDLKVLGIK